MDINNSNLASILRKGGYLDEEDLKKAEASVSENGESLVDYLLSQNLLTSDLIGQAIAEHLKVSYLDLNSNPPAKELVLSIPEDIAKKFQCVLFNSSDEGKRLTIATSDPKADGLKEEIEKIFPDAKVTFAYSMPDDIKSLFSLYQKPLETRFSKILESKKRVAPEILDEIFEDAYTFHASDIHLEPRAGGVLVRFRVDGVLHDAGRLPREYYENILNRIKVLSRLRIDEHFSAQDGSMRFEKGDKVFDLRTSIVPTVEGEKVVLRILAAYIQGLNLVDLGLSETHQKILEDASNKPFGMILVTGPTGSGKTTTLYAVLKLLNNPEDNITTIEDPVEYKIAGVNQIQVNTQAEMTFAKGLRSIVRQDPDVILVGEIRDEETAEIAVNAALTGHLLLSTFHANDAATAIPRLLDMNIEPFLLSSTLEVVVAQRLIRKICSNCRHSVDMTKKEVEDKYSGIGKYFSGKDITLYSGRGCEACNQTGYKGRTAIFEFIKVTPELKDLILKNPSTREIWKIAKSQGSEALFEDGVEKVKAGVTTLEELMRVAPPSPDLQ